MADRKENCLGLDTEGRFVTTSVILRQTSKKKFGCFQLSSSPMKGDSIHLLFRPGFPGVVLLR